MKKILLLLVFMTAGIVVFADENKFLKEYMNVIESKDGNKIEFTIRDYKETELLSSSLGKFIKKEKDPYKKAMLIYLAGRLKLENTTLLLIDTLDFVYRDPNASSLRMARWYYFPSIGALSNIGMKSVKYLVYEVADRSCNYPDILLLFAIRYVIRSNIMDIDSVLFTKLILEGAYKEEENSQWKENLKKAIDLISQPDYLEIENKYMRSEINKAQEKSKVPGNS